MTRILTSSARQALLALLSEWCDNNVVANTLDECELLAEEVRDLVGQAVFEAGLHFQEGKSTYKGSHIPCSCGDRARFLSYRTRWIRTLYGEAQMKRAYYHCSACHKGQFPWDIAQGLTKKTESPRLKSVVCQVMGRLVYAEGVALLADLCGVHMEESTAESLVKEVGMRIRQEEQARVKIVQTMTERATAERLMVDDDDDCSVVPLEMKSVQGSRLYIGADATTAHIDGSWHNVQNGIVFTVSPDANGRDSLAERAYLAGRMDMESLGWRLRTLAMTWNIQAYDEIVFLADGAPCNWNLASAHFPGAIQILDFWHASEHVWELGRALYRQDDPAQKALSNRWVEDRLNSLKTQGPTSLLRALRRRRGKTAEQKEALRKALHYFEENTKRMNYPQHLAAGRMIGSGPIEAACKSVVGARLKQTGMRWSNVGADAILAVRTTLLNRETESLRLCAKAA